MAQPSELMNTGGERFSVGDTGSFRTFTDGPAPTRTRVTSLPVDTPTHFHAAIQNADTVHLVGPGQGDQAKAITYGVYPEIARGRTVWSADLTGHRVTDDLTSHAFRSGIGSLHWPDVSPTRLVESHREVDVAQAAKLVVDSMPDGEQADPALNTARVIHLTRIFETMKEERVPLLGGGYNAVGEALRSEQRANDYKIDNRISDKVRKMYATEHARTAAQEVLGPVHVHMEALLRGDNKSKPTKANGPDTKLFNFGVRDSGLFVASRRKLLATHIDIRCSEDESARPWNDPRPQQVAMAGVESVDPETLLHIQQSNEEDGARTLYVFGAVNATTEAVIGSDRAVTGSLGGLNGPDAEKVADAVGKKWQKAVTSRSVHHGDSATIGGGKGGASVSGSTDETTTWEARHVMSMDAAQHVAPDSVTLTQEGILHKNVPFMPRPQRGITSGHTEPRPRVKALPTEHVRTKRWSIRSLGRGRSED